MDPEPQLVGTWRLRSLDNTDDSVGFDAAAAGQPQADGLIMYDASGSMSAQIISRARHPGALPDDYHAYLGTYTVDPATTTITHHRIANNNPDAPRDVVRQYQFVSNVIVLLIPP